MSPARIRNLVLLLLVALLLRIGIDVLLSNAGYFYGEDSDSFWRLGLSWHWSREPFFNAVYWLPLQFSIVGSTFLLLRPIFNAATMLVPVAWNHIFFLGSLAIAYLFASELGGAAAGVVAVALAISSAEDIWTTFSGLSEPLIVLCGMTIGYCLYKSTIASHSVRLRYLFLTAIASFIAAATHYEGWFIAATVLPFLGLEIWQEVRRSAPGRSRRLTALLGATLLLISFPAVWIIANELVSTQPLHLLQKAQSYHQWFLEATLVSRLTSVPSLLWNAAPVLLLASFVAVPMVLSRRPKAAFFLSPGLVYVALLAFAGLMAYAVPDMHNRYALFPIWQLIPFVAVALTQSVLSRKPLFVAAGLALMLVTIATGIRGAFNYTNWADSPSRAVAELLDHQMEVANQPLNVIVESEPCLYPVGAIANSVPRPDWINTIAAGELLPSSANSYVATSPADLYVLTNPITKHRFAGAVSQVAAVGDYLVLAPSAHRPVEESRVELPQNWHALPGTTLLLADTTGATYFGFDPAPTSVGDAAGMEIQIDTTPNECLVMHAQVQDRYESDAYPWALLQQLVVNNIVLWSHDLSANRTCGWQNIDYYLMPVSDRLHIQLRVLAATGPSLQIDWPYASLTGVRDLRISQCP